MISPGDWDATELKVIEDNALHEALVGDRTEEVTRALRGFCEAVPDGVVHLDLAVSTLSQLLRAQSGIRTLVADVVALGASPLSEAEIFDALARWIIDNQLGRGVNWDASLAPRRLNR